MQISEPSNSLKAQDSAQEIRHHKEQRVKLWHRIEVGILGAVMVAMWGLLGLPIILYHLPVNINQTEFSISNASCSRKEGSLYTGECRAELAALQTCLPNETATSDVYVSEGLDFIELDSQICTLKAGLKLIGASSECESAAISFFCLYLFGLCDASQNLHRPSSSDCISISTEICVSEWTNITTEYSSVLTFPQCDSFGMTDTICNKNGTSPASSPTPNSPASSMVFPLPTTENKTGNCSNSGSCNAEVCSAGFYCSGHGVCLPRCDEWEENSHAQVVALDVVVLLVASFGGISGALVLVLSCVFHKKMFVFPLVIVVYLTITLECLAIIVLISFIDRRKFYCSSCDLFQSENNPTPFCNFLGAVVLYVIFQVAIWWFCHVLLMFWKIQFPFHAKHCEGAGYMKYIHIAVVALALLIPVIPIIIIFGVHRENAFRPGVYPPILCVTHAPHILFYAVILPIVILYQFGVTLLILLFRVIRKHHGLLKKKSLYKIGTPERKILIIFCYSVILIIIVTLAFALSARNVQELRAKRIEYFQCEAFRNDSDPSCPRSYLDYRQSELIFIGFLLIALFPTVNLIFVVDRSDVKKLWKKVYGSFHSSQTDNS